MKILAIIGSPRKKETYLVLKKLEERVGKQKELEMEYLFLNQYQINDCLGCHACILKGEDYCREKEKINEIKSKIMASDLIILASPTYNDHVTALMKKWFDYMTYLWHRPELFGKAFVLIGSGGGMFKSQFQYMEKNVKAWGGYVLGSCGVPHYESLTPKFQAKADKSLDETAAKIVSFSPKQPYKRPSFGQLMWFNMWKLNARATKASGDRDYPVWLERNWFDATYYYPTKINPFTGLATKLIVPIMRSMMRKVYVGY